MMTVVRLNWLTPCVSIRHMGVTSSAKRGEARRAPAPLPISSVK